MEPSSSEADDSDVMFPTANDPPTATSQLSEILIPADDPALDLSPPASQDPPPPDFDTAQDGEAMDTSDAEHVVKNGVRSNLSRRAADAYEPGAKWNNKKARDEWQRAWTNLEDKNFSLSKCW